MPDCTASHASVCPHKAAHDATRNWSIPINHRARFLFCFFPFRSCNWHNRELIIKIDGLRQKRCSLNNVFIAPVSRPSVMHDLRSDARKTPRSSSCVCAPLLDDRKKNKKTPQNPDALAGVPHVQLVWTHLPTLDGVNNWAANFRGHFHIREKSHAECKGGR